MLSALGNGCFVKTVDVGGAEFVSFVWETPSAAYSLSDEPKRFGYKKFCGEAGCLSPHEMTCEERKAHEKKFWNALGEAKEEASEVQLIALEELSEKYFGLACLANGRGGKK